MAILFVTISFGYQVKKGSTNMVVDCLSQPPFFRVLTIFTTSHLGFQTWNSQYLIDSKFGQIYKSLQHPTFSNLVPLQDFQIKEGLFYKFDKLCVPCDHRSSLLKAEHSTLYGGHFGK